MNDFLNRTKEQQITIIEQIAARVNLAPQVIEKDLWVTAILQIVFSLPFADKLVFRGGTSLSKVWNVIERFSEDIDLSVDRQHFGLDGDLTKKQLKKLRKESSLFVKEEFCNALQDGLNHYGLKDLCKIEVQPDGEGDSTYPEPRKVFIRYQSLFDKMNYVLSEIVLEIGSRALFEPTAKSFVKSMISQNSDIDTSVINLEIITTVPEKTFLEKAFLLHEIFVGNGSKTANRRSRHLYDLERMMDKDFALKAMSDIELWNTIQHHREIFTPISGVDYKSDIRKNICLTPPQDIIDEWQQDYEFMQQTMIHGSSLPFDSLLKRLEDLQKRYRMSD
ncbi:MAG: nucleotidyl transferase AbiEii/AbiGii toxin family protein [Bacteroidales bacterium]|nr:nucleotidyl transferase AbiEii/AbiGii toxin family protein [Bacteroidales bacterium]